MRASPLRSVAAVMAVLLGSVACGDDDDPFAPSSIAGGWSFSHEASNRAAGLRCAGSGIVWFRVAGDSLEGRSTFPRECTGVLLPVATDHVFTGVIVDASTVRWNDTLGCTYTGRVVPTHDEMTGDVVCTVAVHERDVTLTGTWSATR